MWERTRFFPDARLRISQKKKKKNTPQHEAPLLTDFHGWLVAPPFLSLSLLGDEADAEKT